VFTAAEIAGDKDATLMALAAEASTAWPRGRFDRAEELYLRCIDIATVRNNSARLRHAYTLLAMTLALGGRLDEARASIARAVDTDPDASSSDVLVAEFSTHIAWFAGELAQTQAAAEGAVTTFGPRRLSFVSMLGALAATERGDVTSARSLLEGAAETARERRRWLIRPYERWASGVSAWRAGDMRRALDELERASTSLLEIDATPIAALILLDLVDASVETDSPAATRASERLLEIAEQLAGDFHRGLAAIALAQVDMAGGRFDSAIHHGREAIRLLSGRGYAMFEGRAAMAFGRSLRETGRDEAILTLERAALLFRDCGAVWRRNRCADALRSLGKPGRRAARATGRVGLTKREREVTDLATQGLTDRDIGLRLYIGERTVQTHLTNAYAKLGVRNRIELMQLLGGQRS